MADSMSDELNTDNHNSPSRLPTDDGILRSIATERDNYREMLRLRVAELDQYRPDPTDLGEVPKLHSKEFDQEAQAEIGRARGVIINSINRLRAAETTDEVNLIANSIQRAHHHETEAVKQSEAYLSARSSRRQRRVRAARKHRVRLESKIDALQRNLDTQAELPQDRAELGYLRASLFAELEAIGMHITQISASIELMDCPEQSRNDSSDADEDVFYTVPPLRDLTFNAQMKHLDDQVAKLHVQVQHRVGTLQALDVVIAVREEKNTNLELQFQSTVSKLHTKTEELKGLSERMAIMQPLSAEENVPISTTKKADHETRQVDISRLESQIAELQRSLRTVQGDKMALQKQHQQFQILEQLATNQEATKHQTISETKIFQHLAAGKPTTEELRTLDVNLRKELENARSLIKTLQLEISQRDMNLTDLMVQFEQVGNELAQYKKTSRDGEAQRTSGHIMLEKPLKGDLQSEGSQQFIDGSETKEPQETRVELETTNVKLRGDLDAANETLDESREMLKNNARDLSNANLESTRLRASLVSLNADLATMAEKNKIDREERLNSDKERARIQHLLNDSIARVAVLDADVAALQRQIEDDDKAREEEAYGDNDNANDTGITADEDDDNDQSYEDLAEERNDLQNTLTQRDAEITNLQAQIDQLALANAAGKSGGVASDDRIKALIEQLKNCQTARDGVIAERDAERNLNAAQLKIRWKRRRAQERREMLAAKAAARDPNTPVRKRKPADQVLLEEANSFLGGEAVAEPRGAKRVKYNG